MTQVLVHPRLAARRPARRFYLEAAILLGLATTLILLLINSVVLSKYVFVLLFLLPVLWSLWVVSALFDPRGRLFRLAALWVLIDLVVFATLISLSSVHGDLTHVQGAEAAYVIAYLPFLPFLIMVTHLFSQAGIPGPIGDWATFSLHAGLVSFLLVIGSWTFRALRAP